MRIATMKHPPVWESGSVWTLWMSGDKIIAYSLHAWVGILWVCLDSCTAWTNTITILRYSKLFFLPCSVFFRPLRPFEQCFQTTSTYISTISLVRPTQTACGLCHPFCLSKGKKMWLFCCVCLGLLSRDLWSFIHFPTTTFDVSRVMATCLCFLSLGLCFILHWDSRASWQTLRTVSSERQHSAYEST